MTDISNRSMLDLIFDGAAWASVQGWEEIGVAFVWRHWWFFLFCGVAYLPTIFGLKAWMKNRKAYDLRRALIAWNIFMAAFSGIGFLAIVYPFIYTWIYPGIMSIDEFICNATYCYTYGECARWVFIFNMSKILEFMDTIFIVLRKRPLHFLHYYHHVITYSFCLYSGQYMHHYNCGGYFFCLMNFGVHAIMYAYYALRAMGYRPSFDVGITVLQILQMVGGVAVITVSTRCDKVDRVGTAFGYGIYLSFFLLFCHFFKGRYIDAKPALATAKPASAGKTTKQNKQE